MKAMTSKVLKTIGVVIGLAVVCLVAYVFMQVRAFDASMSKIYDVPLLALQAATDPVAVARGHHLAESMGGCTGRDCHTANLAGGATMELGPLGKISCPNASQVLSSYSDGELARLLRFGVKKNGQGVRMMPVQDFNWWPDSDLAAVMGFLRTMPLIPKENGATEVGTLGKVLDRRDMIEIDVARRIVGAPPIPPPPAPAPTMEYGAYIARLCKGCHGAGYGGGPIPGAPPSLPVPRNLTPDPTGLGPNYTYEQFLRVLNDGIKLDGKKLDPFMPFEALSHLDDTEKHALFAFLRSLPPKPFGSR